MHDHSPVIALLLGLGAVSRMTDDRQIVEARTRSAISGLDIRVAEPQPVIQSSIPLPAAP